MTFFFTYFFMVWIFWRPQDWLLPQLFGLPILDAVFVFALFAMLLEADQGRIRFPTRMPQVFLLVGVWVAGIMSHVANTYFAGMMQTIPALFKICIFTILFIAVTDRPSRLRAVAFAFVGMACVMAWHAVLQQNRGSGFLGAPPYYIPPIGDRPGHTRSYFFGIFGDPNDLAQVLAAAIPFAFVLFRRGFVSLIAGGAITTLLVRAVLSTHSRGGLIALSAVAATGLAVVVFRRGVPLWMGLLMIGGLMLCPYAGQFMDESAHERVVFWGIANARFKTSPIFGIGYDMFWQLTEKSMVAHNAFVHCYTETGLFGYWFWFLLAQLGVVGAWRTLVALRDVEGDDSRYVRRFSAAAITSMMGFLASAYFLSRAFVYPMFFMFAILASIPRVAEYELPEDHEPLLRPRRDILAYGTLGVLGSITYIYISIILLNKAYYG